MTAITYCGTCGAALEDGQCPNCGDGGFEPVGKVGLRINRVRMRFWTGRDEVVTLVTKETNLWMKKFRY